MNKTNKKKCISQRMFKINMYVYHLHYAEKDIIIENNKINNYTKTN